MRAPYSFVCLTFATLCAAVALAARQQPADPFRSGREVLEIQTSVQDAAGRPLTDLQPSDFTVRIDGEARRVLAAHLFGTDGVHTTNDVVPTPRFARNADAPPGRLVVFAIDRESIRSGSERPLIDTAAKMLDSLSPADAVGAFGLPAGGIDLTRDHAAVADAIRTMTGTAPDSGWQHAMSWDEALAYERNDRTTIATVVERECPKLRRSTFDDPQMKCPPELEKQAQGMLLVGRARAQTVLARLSELIGRLGGLRAPKHLILISGGVPFDLDLLSRYRDLANKAAAAHVAMFVVQLDQPAFDASDRGHFANVFGGQQYAAGLGNIAASTGGAFFQGVGRATGVFDRIVSDINYFYQLGVESRPSDANGKTHRVEVRVNRPDAHVRAPAETAVSRARASGAEMIARALTEPTDIAELPLEVATYIMHSNDLEKVRVMISATASDGASPSEWGYAILDGPKVIGGALDRIDPPPPGQPWSATANVDVPPGRYRLRTAIVDAGGRMGVLELPFTAGLRTAGGVQASDLIVGGIAGGQAVPRAHIREDEPGIAMIELSSGVTLADTTGVLQLIRGGTAVPALTRPLVLRTREQDKSVVIGEALLDWAALPPGTYTASAVLARTGAPFARVSRVIEIVPAAPAAAAPSAHPADTARRNPELDDALQRVGQYVSEYGQQASLIIGVERYEQRYPNAPSGEPTARRLTADFVLVRTAGITGWTGFRGVVDVDGKPIPDRQDRLEKLFRSDTPDVVEARRIADESARFNIGPTRRNFNEPTSALFFMLPATQSRFAFTPKGHARLGGVDTWEIDFEERSRPTLIKTADGHDIAAHGTIWVVPADGTVGRTRLMLTGFAGPGSSSSIDVTYARDARLQLWLPATMSERHAGIIRQVSTRGRGMGATVQAVMTGTATYSDFKRFDTATEIK